MSTPIPHELAKFSELAHRWWDPESEFRPLHEINPLRLDWIDGLAAAERQARARRRLRRRHPRRLDGARAAPRCSASTWPTKALRVAQLHALEAGTPRRRVPRGRGRGAGRRAARQRSTSSPAWRCSSTCPTRRRSCAPAPRWSSRAAGCSSRRSTATPSPSLFAIVGAEYVLQPAAQGHARVREVHPPERAGRAGAAAPASTCVHTRGMEYNPLTPALLALAPTPASTTCVACRKPA